MKVVSSALLILLLVTIVASAGADPIHSDARLDSVIIQANDLFLDAQFDRGIDLLKGEEKNSPGSPAVSFFTANGYWWKIFRVYIYDKDAKSTDYDKDFDAY